MTVFFFRGRSGRIQNIVLASLLLLLLLWAAVASGRADEEVTAPPPLQSTIATVNAVEVSGKDRSNLAGRLSPVSINAFPAPDNAEEASVLEINQNASKLLLRSLIDVQAFITAKHGWPIGQRLQIDFAHNTYRHDGTSTSLAIGLLLTGLIEGVQFDQKICITGRLKEDGSVDRVGGMHAKMVAAVAGSCRVFLVPEANLPDVCDLVLLHGHGVLLKTQVVGVSRFSEAHAVAVENKPPDVEAALRSFEAIAQQLNAASGEQDFRKTIATRKIKKELEEILTKLPGHLAARYLTMMNTGTTPKVVSLAGSFHLLMQIGKEIQAAAALGQDGSGSVALARALKQIDQYQQILDPGAFKYASALRRYGNLLLPLALGQQETDSASRELRRAAAEVDTERRSLRENPRIRRRKE